MSEYEAYEGQSMRPEEGSPADPLNDSADRYYNETGEPEVLARVPDLQASLPEPGEPLGTTSRGRRRSSSSSPRSMATIGAMMLLVGVGGFMLGRAGRPDAAEESDFFDPPPSAATASEAPSWKPNNLTAPEVPQASPDLTVPSFGKSPVFPPAEKQDNPTWGGNPAAPSMAVASPAAVTPTQTPWSYPGAGADSPSADQYRFSTERARDVAAGRVGTLVSPDYSGMSSQPQAGANRGMTLEAPLAPTNQYRGTDYRAGGYPTSGHGEGASPRLAARPQTPNSTGVNARGQYPTTTRQAYPSTSNQGYQLPQSQTPHAPYDPSAYRGTPDAFQYNGVTTQPDVRTTIR